MEKRLAAILAVLAFGGAAMAAEFRSEKFSYRIELPEVWRPVTAELVGQLTFEGDGAEAAKETVLKLATDPETDYFLLGVDAPYADNLNVVAMDGVDFPLERYLPELPAVFTQVYTQKYNSPAEVSGMIFCSIGEHRALTFVTSFPELELKQLQYMIEAAPRRTLCFTLTTRPQVFDAAAETLAAAMQTVSFSEQPGVATPGERVD